MNQTDDIDADVTAVPGDTPERPAAPSVDELHLLAQQAAIAEPEATDNKRPADPLLVIEAALLCSGRALTLRDLKTLFGHEVRTRQLPGLLNSLSQLWVERNHGIELVETPQGWRAQARPEMASHLAVLDPDHHVHYSKAVIETLAIIAYLQPVTRRIIEEQRGVSVSPNVLAQLEERGWIEVIGQQESPGRPALYATTFKFLDDMKLMTLSDLPELPDESAEPIPTEPAAQEPVDFDPYEPYDGPIDGVPQGDLTPPRVEPAVLPAALGTSTPPPAAEHVQPDPADRTGE